MSLTVSLLQRVLVGDRLRSDFVQTTFPHIPGAVVRGALAAAWLARHGGTADADRGVFLRLFEGGVRFGPLFRDYPPTPLSIVTHKYGVTGRNQPDCDDLEFDQALTGPAPPRCPTCDVPLEPVATLRGEKPTVSRRTSVAISTADVAARGEIVTRDTLDPNQDFRGNLVADDPNLLSLLAGLGPIRLGGRRTTQGMAEIVLDDSQPELPERCADGRVVLRLRSPGVFVDDHGRPRHDPNLAELSRVLGSSAEVHERWFRWVNVGGWHTASGLPKPTEVAAAPGSTYVISATAGISDNALLALTRRGLGLRRHEGFGDVGGPFSIVPGKMARQAEAQRLAKLANQVAGVLGLSTDSARWARLDDLLDSYQSGRLDAEQVRGMLGEVPGHVDTALRRLLSYQADEIATIRERWPQ